MEYGLRHYEAFQRLLWFLFFLACLIIAYPFAQSYQNSHLGLIAATPGVRLDYFRSSDFWLQTNWIGDKSFVGFAIVYLMWVEFMFLGGRFLWLIVQYVAKHFVRGILDSTVKRLSGPSRASTTLPGNPERFFPKEMLTSRIGRIPLKFMLHPVQRLSLMLANPNATISSEELIEKERRIAETDWQILWSSWAPFRCVLWLLPLLALMQSSWILYFRLEPILKDAKELHDILRSVFGGLVPLVQVIALAVVLNLGAGLLKRLENLYLSNLDALLYDKLLSRLPFQSSDTVILLDAMQRHFHELQNILRRMENRDQKEREPQDTRS